MASDLGPFNVGYPVDFRTGGDTTRDAFGKHIQEIMRIYGILNALDSGKASSLELATAIANHVDDANPHPNWKPSLKFSDLTGNVDASKVVGLLSNATINAANVIGIPINLSVLLEQVLTDLVELKNKIKDYEAPTVNSNDGYTKLPNGILIQWGKTNNPSTGVKTITFPTAFPQECLSITVSILSSNYSSEYYNRFVIYSQSTTGFSGYSQTSQKIDISYIAIGR